MYSTASSHTVPLVSVEPKFYDPEMKLYGVDIHALNYMHVIRIEF